MEKSPFGFEPEPKSDETSPPHFLPYAYLPSESSHGGIRTGESSRIQSLDQQIHRFVQLSLEGQRDLWTSNEFAALFPHMVQRLVSPEGRTSFSHEVRSNIYEGSLYALGQRPISQRDHRTGAESILRIGGSSMNFDLTTGNSSLQSSKRDDKESLFRINFACIILLGISLPDIEGAPALKRVIDTVFAKPHPDKETQALGLLLPLNSLARKWVKDNQLDIAAGREWDTAVAELIVNLPQNTINPNRRRPGQLPSEMTTTNAHAYYSPEAYAVFVDYAADIATVFTSAATNPQRIALSSRLSKGLMAFRENIRRFPPEFKEHILIKTAVDMIAIATHDAAVQGTIPIARDLLPPRKRRQPARLHWYHSAIRQLLS